MAFELNDTMLCNNPNCGHAKWRHNTDGPMNLGACSVCTCPGGWNFRQAGYTGPDKTVRKPGPPLA